MARLAFPLGIGAQGPLLVTVVCPVNQPREGYVVYEDTRRAAAGRRLNRTLDALHLALRPEHQRDPLVQAVPAAAY